MGVEKKIGFTPYGCNTGAEATEAVGAVVTLNFTTYNTLFTVDNK